MVRSKPVSTNSIAYPLISDRNFYQINLSSTRTMEITKFANTEIVNIHPLERSEPLAAAEIIKYLSRRLPEKLLETKNLKGTKITFLSWKYIPPILDKYARGWCWEITHLQSTSDRIFLVGRLTIPTSDGLVWREATGTECLKETKTDKVTGEVIEREIAYGDPSSNAESMAFRRACAKFGLGLYLYSK